MGYWAILGIAGSLPLEIKYGNMVIIAAFVISLFYFRKKQFLALRHITINYPFLFFVAVAISGLFSKDVKEGLSRLDRHLLPLLLTVIMLALYRVSSKKILRFFTIGITLFTLLLTINLLWRLVKGNALNTLIFHEYTRLYDQHPVYFALMILIGLLFILFDSKKLFSKQHFNWKVFAKIMVLFSGLVFCASKAVIFLCFIFILIGAILYGGKTKQKVLLSVLLLVLVFITSRIGFIKDRFADGVSLKTEIVNFKPSNDFELKKQFDLTEKRNITDLELRVIFAKISIWHSIADRSFLFGYGAGDAQNYFDYYLYSYNLGPNWYQGFNMHNQYLHIYWTYGIFMLILFILYLYKIFESAIKNHDYLHLAAIFSFCFVFFFEVTLVRNKGIILFYFFNLLFLLDNNYFENSNTRNAGNTQ